MTAPHPSSPRLAHLAYLALCSLASCFSLHCAAAEAIAPPSVALMNQVKAAVGDAECGHPSECQVVPVGAKPCGGPSGYLAWSTRRTDKEALLAAIQAHAAAEKKEHETDGLVSDCRQLPPPSATCRPRASDGKKTCQLGQGGVRGAD